MRRVLVVVLALSCALAAQAKGPEGGTVTGFALAADGRTPQWAATDRGLFVFRRGTWERDESLGCSEITSVLHNGDRLVVNVRGEGAFFRIDGEERWHPAFQGIKGPYGNDPGDVTVLLAEPGTRRRLYLGTDGKGLFTSANAGRNWYPLWEGVENAPPTARAVRTLLPARGSRPMIMGTDGAGLYARPGETWVPRGEGLPANLRVSLLAEDPDDPAHIALGTMGEGAWESRDGGVSWKLLRKGLYGVVSALSIGEGGAVAAWFGSEGLAVFREGRKARPEPLGRLEVACLEARRGGGWLAGLRNDGVALLDPSGAVSGLLADGLLSTRVQAFVAGNEPGSMWCGDMNGVFYTADSGRTWSARDEGFPTAPVTALLWREGRLFAGTRGLGIAMWSPGEGRWEDRSNGLGTANSIRSFLRAGDGSLFVGTEGGVLYSSDGGAQWARRSAGLPQASSWMLAAVEGDPRALWAAGPAGLYRTADAGLTWEQEIHGDFTNIALTKGRLLLVGSGRLLEYANGSLKPLFEPDSGDFVHTMLLAGGGDLWVGTRRGLWLVRGGERQLLWEGAAVLALGRASDGRLHAGTDGRGVQTFRIEEE